MTLLNGFGLFSRFFPPSGVVPEYPSYAGAFASLSLSLFLERGRENTRNGEFAPFRDTRSLYGPLRRWKRCRDRMSRWAVDVSSCVSITRHGQCYATRRLSLLLLFSEKRIKNGDNDIARVCLSYRRCTSRVVRHVEQPLWLKRSETKLIIYYRFQI